MNVKINAKENSRIDQLLSNEIVDLSRSQINKLIEAGNIRVNGVVLTKSGQKFIGELDVEIDVNLDQEETIVPWEKTELIDIIKETEDYMIINKPSGLSVHPGSGNKSKTLLNILVYMKKELSDHDETRPGIVHRIDKNTSGLLIISKNNEFHRYIQKQFEERSVDKDYIALVNGNLQNTRGMIDAPIGRDKNNRLLMTVTSDNSKKALTIFEVVERFKAVDLVNFKILTGRTHQIRVHSKYIGNPIVNDPEYSTTLDEYSGFGQFLHAERISFIDMQGNEVEYKAKPPKEFDELLNKLRKEKDVKN